MNIVTNECGYIGIKDTDNWRRVDYMDVRQVMDSNQASGGIREGFPGQRMVVLPRPVVLRTISGCLPLKLVPSDVGYFPDAADHYVNRPSGVAQCIIILCVRGRGWVRIGKLEHDIQPGDLAVILPDQAHSYGCGALHPWTIHWCHAAGPAVNYFTDMLIRRDVLPILHLGNYLRLIPFYETMTEELTSGYSLAHLTVAAMALGHLLALIAAGGQSAQINQSHHHRIPLAIEYMKSRWQRSVTVHEIARACNLSTSHFTVLFKKFTGYPPLDYFLRLKMQRAAEMLDTTNRPLKEIAADIGLSDPLYFSRVFNRIYGLSPSAYRRTTKG